MGKITLVNLHLKIARGKGGQRVDGGEQRGRVELGTSI